MWRPGDQTPFRRAGGNKRKRAKSKTPNKDSKSPEKKIKQGQKYEQSNTVLSLPDSNAFDGAVSASVAAKNKSKQSGKIEISSNIQNLRFMARKQEKRQEQSEKAIAAKKVQESKWHNNIDHSAAAGKRLVCQPLFVSPRNAIGTRVSRRSLASFNPKLEAAVKQSQDQLAADHEGELVEESALGPQEMLTSIDRHIGGNLPQYRNKQTNSGSKRTIAKKRKKGNRN